MTFVTREIELSFRLKQGELADKKENVVQLKGHRAELILETSGGVLSTSDLQLRVFGMKASDMNAFSTSQLLPLATKNDAISISAGDSIHGVKKIFDGTIVSALVNYRGMPDVAFDVNARPGYFYQVAPAAANSYKGSADVASIVESLAKQMGYAFKNEGVTARLSNPNFPGTLIQQLKSVANAARIICKIENGIVTIWPNGQGFGEEPIEIGPNNGLVGYPTFIPAGIQIVTEFNPDLSQGRIVHLQTSIEKARGEWVIQAMRHELSTLQAQGPWFTTVNLAKVGYALNVSKN